MQTTFSKISNSIFEYFIVFAILFLWLNFYIENLFTASAISLIATILLLSIVREIRKRKHSKYELTLAENKKIQEISFNFLLSDANKVLTFYKILLSSKHDCKIIKDQIKWDNTLFIPHYSKQELSKDDIANIIRQNTACERIIIAAINYTDEARTFVNKLEQRIVLLNESDTFVLMKERDYFPELTIKTKTTKKFQYKDLKNIAFVKKNAKHYLYSGIIILITSFFIRYNIYYTVFATLLFIFSAICFFNKQSTPNNEIDNI